MLILIRDIHETIMIGHDIKIKVLGISNKQVRIGIHAPREIPVHRGEVYNRILFQDNNPINTYKNENKFPENCPNKFGEKIYEGGF